MTLTYVLIAVAVVVVAVIASRIVFRRDPHDEVEQFHRARTMTTNWSQQYHDAGLPEQPGKPYPDSAEAAAADADERRR